MKKTPILFLHFALCILLYTAASAAVSDGYVVRVESMTVYLDWGSPSGAQAGDRFEIYREGPALKHPVTGEMLGKTKDRVAAGALDRLEAKFAVGHLDAGSGAPLVGDRTQWMSAQAVAKPMEPKVSTGPAMSELWRSEPLEKDAAGLAFADLDGDGQKDILIAYRKKIVAYRFKDKKLEPMASFEKGRYHRWLAIDTMDLKQEGREEVFATTFLEGINRAHVIVLRYENGAFKEMADIEGFVRTVQRPDGTRHLYWQTLSRSQEVSYTAVSELKWEKNKYKPGKPLDLKLFSDQLFGFAWGGWYKGGEENFAVLEHGERIRIYSKDVRWKSSDVFGGTKNDFSTDTAALDSGLGSQRTGSFYPRLFAYRPPGADRDSLIVPTNFPELGIRMTHLKIYKRSEIAGLVWNGLEMKPAWRIPIQGYLADYGVIDLLGLSQPQVWAAAVGPGDKTILLSYSLP